MKLAVCDLRHSDLLTSMTRALPYEDTTSSPRSCCIFSATPPSRFISSSLSFSPNHHHSPAWWHPLRRSTLAIASPVHTLLNTFHKGFNHPTETLHRFDVLPLHPHNQRHTLHLHRNTVECTPDALGWICQQDIVKAEVARNIVWERDWLFGMRSHVVSRTDCQADRPLRAEVLRSAYGLADFIAILRSQIRASVWRVSIVPSLMSMWNGRKLFLSTVWFTHTRKTASLLRRALNAGASQFLRPI